MTDKKFEELLKEAVEQCAEKEWEEISQKSKKIRYKPSKEFDEKMENLYQKESCQNNFIGDEQTKSKSKLKDTKSEKRYFHMGKGKKRIILVAALVAVLLCGSVFAKETIREWRSNLIVKQEEDGLRIEYGGKEKEDTREDSKNAIDYSVAAKYKLKWVPKGYKKETEKSDEKDLYWYYMTYSNEKGDLIIYNQHNADYVISMAFDKQKDRKEEVSVCGVKGKYFTHEDKGVIIYEVNGVTYTIQGAVSKQELIKMLEKRERIG